MACWSEQKLTTVLQHKAPRRRDLIGHWTKENSFPLGALAVNHRRSLPLVATWGPGSAILALTPIRAAHWLDPQWRVSVLRYDWLLSRKSPPLLVDEATSLMTTPTSDSSHAPLPRSFALYNSDWLSLEPADWSDSHAAFLVLRGKTYRLDTRPLFPGAALCLYV